MIAFIIFLFVLGILVVVHEFGHFIAAQKMGVKVEQFSLGFGPRLFMRKKNGTEYSLSAVPLGGYVKLAGDSLEEYKGHKYEYLAQAPGRRFWIIFCGPLLNYILGFLCFWLVFFAGYPSFTTKVGGLLDGFGAKKAGIQVGDKIVSVDGKKVLFWEDMQKIIQDKKEASAVELSIARNNQEMKIMVNIREESFDDAIGQKRKLGLLGVTPYDEIVTVRHGIFESFSLAIKQTWDLTELTYKALWRMVTGKLSARESVTGPLGIYMITSKAARLGIIPLVHLVAVLSLSLGIFNLLPLPVLDGGHIFLLALEKLRGKYISLKTEQLINRVGVTFIITIALLVTYNDLARLFGDKISKFFTR